MSEVAVLVMTFCLLFLGCCLLLVASLFNSDDCIGPMRWLYSDHASCISGDSRWPRRDWIYRQTDGVEFWNYHAFIGVADRGVSQNFALRRDEEFPRLGWRRVLGGYQFWTQASRWFYSDRDCGRSEVGEVDGDALQTIHFSQGSLLPHGPAQKCNEFGLRWSVLMLRHWFGAYYSTINGKC